jgi:hypothetical protein
MNDSQKFYADVRRLMKYERAQNGGRYNAKAVCTKIASLFASSNTGLGSLPDSIADYWTKTYIDSSIKPDSEPTEENLDRLAAMQTFLDGTADETTDILSAQDWQELGDMVNYEAEDLPLDVLSTLMTILVDKKALQ